MDKKKRLKTTLIIMKTIFQKILKMFLKSKYLWGGKTAQGIDCSALIQIYYFFNNIYFPRDTKDQIKFLKKLKILNCIKKISFSIGRVMLPSN